MFRQKDNQPDDKKSLDLPKNSSSLAEMDKKNSVPKTEQETIKDLLEKNLKWSQIIYEQNRKIHSKMMWTAIAGWVRVFLLLVPLLWAAWYLPGFVKNLQNNYGYIFGGKQAGGSQSADSLEQLYKILPLDAAKQEQLKAILE